MTSKDGERDVDRRGFLRAAALGAPATAVLVATGTDADASQAAAEGGSGLRRTPHVDAYLKTARF